MPIWIGIAKSDEEKLIQTPVAITDRALYGEAHTPQRQERL